MKVALFIFVVLSVLLCPWLLLLLLLSRHWQVSLNALHDGTHIHPEIIGKIPGGDIELSEPWRICRR